MYATPQAQPPTVVIPLAPATFVVIDLETGDAPAEAVEQALAGWTPPGNLKDPVKIDARRAEAVEKIRERAALLDASPILCVALQTDRARLIFNGMDHAAPDIDGWPVLPCGDERGLLLALRAWLDAHTTAETAIVGHNIRGFDLTKLRHACVRHSLRLPALLKPKRRDEEKAEVVDTMALFKAFSMEHRDDYAIALDTVAASLGIPRPKQYMTGADCLALVPRGPGSNRADLLRGGRGDDRPGLSTDDRPGGGSGMSRVTAQ